MREWDEIKEQEAKDRYYEFKETPEYKLRDIKCIVANDLKTPISTVEIQPQTDDFFHILCDSQLIGYVYRIDDDFLIRIFKELT